MSKKPTIAEVRNAWDWAPEATRHEVRQGKVVCAMLDKPKSGFIGAGLGDPKETVRTVDFRREHHQPHGALNGVFLIKGAGVIVSCYPDDEGMPL